jgi:hypothetical protein
MSVFTEQATALARSIHLGYDAESQDPNFLFTKPSDAEIEWLASWLVSEEWRRERDTDKTER